MFYNLLLPVEDITYIQSIIPTTCIVSVVYYNNPGRALFVVEIGEETATVLTLRYGIENLWKR